MKKISVWVFSLLAILIIILIINYLWSFGGGPVSYKDLIKVSYPVNNEKISSPLIIKGEARGNWYFEASFPVILTNWDGLIIAEGIAQAEGEWMTADYVPFTATLEFNKPNYGKNGFLILKKDNPSGLSKFDDALEIPINFE